MFLSTKVMTTLNQSNPAYPPKACGPVGRWWNLPGWGLVEEVRWLGDTIPLKILSAFSCCGCWEVRLLLCLPVVVYIAIARDGSLVSQENLSFF